MTIREFKEAARTRLVYQRGPNDTGGWERDSDWRGVLCKARSWAQVTEALPSLHPMIAIAANDGERP